MNSAILFAKMVGPVAASSALIWLSPALASDEAERIKALERQLEISLQLIEKLSSRVADLERTAKPVATKTEPDANKVRAEQAPESARLQTGVNPVSEGESRREHDSGLALHGFADVGGVWSAGADPLKQRGFTVGTLDLYLTPQFSDRVSALVELVFEFDESGRGVADMERLQLGYAVSDAMTVWLGRFHTPLGLWNTSFHHGALLQTSISRPRFVEFEDQIGILPVHSVGVWATGKLPLGADKITYDAYLSNGTSIRQRHLDPTRVGPGNDGKLLGFNLGYQPAGALGGLTVGVHGFGSTVKALTAAGGLLSSTRVRAVGGYWAYDANDWETLGEYYRFDNADTGVGAKYASTAWYAQVGRAFGSLTPYVRFERASLNPDDNFFRTQNAGRSYERGVIGARYAMDSRSAIKLELSRTVETSITQLDENGAQVPFAGGRYRRAAIQYSIAF